MATLREIMDGVLFRLQGGGGAGVQRYGEPVLQQMIRHKFDILFDKYPWPRYYVQGQTWTLDGLTGRANTDVRLAGLRRFEDIEVMWYKDEETPLPRAPYGSNSTLIKRRCVVADPDPSKVFKILPIDTLETVNANFKSYPESPETFFADESSEIHMDFQLLVLGTAFDYLNQMGTGRDNADKLLGMYEDRERSVIYNFHKGGVLTGEYSNDGGIYSWQETDNRGWRY